MTFTDEHKKKFYKCGENNRFSKSINIINSEKIIIGNNCYFGNNVSLNINTVGSNNDLEWNIKISDNIYMNDNCIIEALNRIEIGKYVMFGPDVFISDNNHKYDLWKMPIMMQGFEKNNNNITIKDGAWIGAGAKILGDVTIGFGVVVAANTVVLKDIPDHCMVAGIPAQIIKICDYRKNQWVKVKYNEDLYKDILQNRGIFGGYDYNRIIELLEKSLNKEDGYKKTIKDIFENTSRLFNEIDIKLQSYQLQSIYGLFNEAVEQVVRVQEILKGINDINTNEALDLVLNLNDDFNKVISAFEGGEISVIRYVLIEMIIPHFKLWKNTILDMLD